LNFVQVNNATARVQTKKPAALPNVLITRNGALSTTLDEQEFKSTQFHLGLEAAAALRGVALQRGRARAYPAAAAAAAAAALARPQLTAASLGNVYAYDSLLAAQAQASTDAYRLQQQIAAAAAAASRPTLSPLASVLSRNTQSTAGYLSQAAAAAGYTAAANAAARAYGAAAAQPPVAYATVPASGYATDPYLGHSIGPVPTYGVNNSVELQSVNKLAAMYRSSYNRFAPY